PHQISEGGRSEPTSEAGRAGIRWCDEVDCAHGRSGYLRATLWMGEAWDRVGDGGEPAAESARSLPHRCELRPFTEGADGNGSGISRTTRRLVLLQNGRPILVAKLAGRSYAPLSLRDGFEGPAFGKRETPCASDQRRLGDAEPGGRRREGGCDLFHQQQGRRSEEHT